MCPMGSEINDILQKVKDEKLLPVLLWVRTDDWPVDDVGQQVVMFQSVVSFYFLEIHSECASINTSFLEIKSLEIEEFKKEPTYSCWGCARNSLEKTSKIVSPTHLPFVNVVKVK